MIYSIIGMSIIESIKCIIVIIFSSFIHNSMRKNDDKLKMAIINIIVPAFTTVLMEANDERKQKMNKVIVVSFYGIFISL